MTPPHATDLPLRPFSFEDNSTPSGHSLLLETARELLDSAAGRELGRLTLVGVALGNLEEGSAVQMALPIEEGSRDPEGAEALDRALDDLRGRYGSGAVTRASLVEREDPGATPVLPD